MRDHHTPLVLLTCHKIPHLSQREREAPQEQSEQLPRPTHARQCLPLEWPRSDCSPQGHTGARSSGGVTSLRDSARLLVPHERYT